MEEEEVKPNKEFKVNLHVTSIEKGKPSRPDYEDEAMTNLTDEGLREIVVEICEKVCCSDDCHCRRDDDGYEFTCESCFIRDWLERVRDAAKKEKVNGETSDGYHTFNELYDHRVLLWINLCLLQHPDMTYLVENHFDGWFLLGCETPQGQISYHCPNKYLGLVGGIKRRHPEFDGHTSKDVISRLERTAIRQRDGGK